MHLRAALVTLVVLLVAGCVKLPLRPARLLPSDSESTHGQLVLHSDFVLPKQHRLIDEIVQQRTDLAEKLALTPSAEPIQVFLFASAEKYQAFLKAHFPEFPNRRAFFVESDTQLAVYAQWGDRIAEDLRHEVAHGYLHASLPNLPLWLDEGLAEYYEMPRGAGGMNRPHLDLLHAEMNREGWRPHLARLEALGGVQSMQQGDYAEAWAWVYFLLETEPEHRTLLQEYLQGLKREGAGPPLSLALRQLHPDPDRTLWEYLSALK